MSKGEIILYTTEDGRSSVLLRAEEGTVWLSQIEIASLFETSPQNINLHIKAIYKEGEVEISSTSKDYLQVQIEGSRRVQRCVQIYNLNMILAIGYRVRSQRGIQFRKWASTHLSEYLVKGFVLNDAQLKEPGGWDYFDELLERIREIRASEKRFYQKIRDIYATASDYDAQGAQAQLFFKKVQNKVLWATTGYTAAELIAKRSDPQLPNMGLKSWKGLRVRKNDVIVAKNYLQSEEINELNRIVVMYLDYAEDQAKRRKTMTMQQWAEKLDVFLAFNERDILQNAGKISADVAEQLAHDRYEQFDKSRKEADKFVADQQDLLLIQNLQRVTKKN